MNFFLFLFLLSDFISFLSITIFSLQSAINVKNLLLGLVVFVSLTSFLKNKISKLELIYIFYLVLLFINAIFSKQMPNLIIFQTMFLLFFPLFIFKLGEKNSSEENIKKFEFLIQLFCLFNFIFMIFEINNTDLLISIGLIEFFSEVKGVSFGINANTFLPFNWHTDFDAHTRRGAGLLLAPLASGMLHAFGGYISFVKFINNKNKKDFLFLIIISIGLLITNSRGPMIFAIISMGIYFFQNKNNYKIIVGEKFFWLMIILAFIYVIGPTIIDAITLQDDRAPGHYYALINNIKNLPQVPILGYGIGVQGAIAAESGLAKLSEGYGTEGAIFSTIYQCGIIFGLIFLIWYLSLIKKTKKKLDDRIFPLILAGLIIMITSEHFYTISGYIYIWYYIGLNSRKNESTASIF